MRRRRRRRRRRRSVSFSIQNIQYPVD